jgi:hypothetical protein
MLKKLKDQIKRFIVESIKQALLEFSAEQAENDVKNKKTLRELVNEVCADYVA